MVRLFVSVVLISGCSFEHGHPSSLDAGGGDDATADATPDAMPRFCATDSHLRLCYSFDPDPLPAAMPNEGAANVSAQLTNVMRAEHLGGGAAAITAASIIYVPATSEVSGIQTFEVSFRADVAPPNNFARVGILDSNIIPPNISLFLYRVDPGYQLRCGLGSALYTFDAPGLQLGTWYRAVCTCNADTLQLFVDDAKIGEVTNASCSSGGSIAGAGVTIGSNNTGSATVVDEWLLGAVDNVRFWDTTVLQQDARP